MTTSNYPNPLDNFRSHSYHFILTVANTTEAHRKMIDRTSDGQGGASFLQSINSASLGERIDLDNDSAYLLVDTRRFSQFSITDFHMQSIYGTGDIANPSITSSDIKMRLVDATGVTFMNFLMDIMRNKIQSTRASAFFMLAIVFTGHNDDVSQMTQTVSSCFIPTIMSGLHFEFFSTGAVFDITMNEIEGNPGKAVPEMISLGDIQAVSSENTSNTVGGMIQNLEDRLNIRSLQFYQKFNNEAFDQTSEQDKKNFVKTGKLVQYMITVPDEWKNFRINTAGKSANIEQVFIAGSTAKEQMVNKQQAATPSNSASRTSYHSFSYTTSIQDAIKIILESSKEFLDLHSEQKRLSGDAITQKTVVNITSDEHTYMLHFDIYPHKNPKIDKDGKVVKVGNNSKTNDVLPNGEIKNVITYDYLFSGKNSHILDFKVDYSPASVIALDTDLSIGQKRFSENSETGQKESRVKDTGQQSTSSFNPLMRAAEPVFPSLKTKDQQSNFSNIHNEEYTKDESAQHIKAKQEYTSTIAYLQFLGSINAQVSVRGNPNIIKKYADRNTRGGIAKHPITISSIDTLRNLRTQETTSAFTSIKSLLSSEKQKYYNDYVAPRINDELIKTPNRNDPLLHGTDVTVGPLYVKINIFTPRVDLFGNQITEGGMFTNQFFYNGYYRVMYIETEFSNGSFKHTLSLIPTDPLGEFSINGPSAQGTK